MCVLIVNNLKSLALAVDNEKVQKQRENTREQGLGGLWHSLKRKRITASQFGLIAKRQYNFESLSKQLGKSRFVQTAAKYGLEIEPVAAFTYATQEKKGMVNL